MGDTKRGRKKVKLIIVHCLQVTRHRRQKMQCVQCTIYTDTAKHTLSRRHTHINIVMSFRLPQCGLWYLQCGFALVFLSLIPSVYIFISFLLPFAQLTTNQIFMCVHHTVRVAMSCGCKTQSFDTQQALLQPNFEEKRNRENWHDNLRSHRISQEIFNEKQANIAKLDFFFHFFRLLPSRRMAIYSQQIEPKNLRRAWNLFSFDMCRLFLLILHPFTFIASFNVTN